MDLNLKMDIKTFVNFYSHIFTNESKQPFGNANLSLPDVDDFFELIRKEFDELLEPSTFTAALSMIDIMIRKTDITYVYFMKHIEDLMSDYSSNDLKQKMVLQIYHQILTSLPDDYPEEQIYSDTITQRLGDVEYIGNFKLQPQLSICTALLIEKFNVDDLLAMIWNDVLSEFHAHVIVYFIPALTTKLQVYKDRIFWRNIAYLITSDVREHRKCGIYLIRHVTAFLKNNPVDVYVESFFKWTVESGDKYADSWSSYLAVMDNLIENQSHLILPSLELRKILQMDPEIPWIPCLLKVYLKTNNKLVLRRTVDILETNFQMLVIRFTNLVPYFRATNNTWMYEEICQNDIMIPSLVKLEDKKLFLEKFMEVEWKSVPMNVWLHRISKIPDIKWDIKTVISIAAKIVVLPNRSIRAHCKLQLSKMISKFLKDLDLRDYITIIEALCRPSDIFPIEYLNMLMHKLAKDRKPFITQQVYNLLVDVEVLEEVSLLKIFDKVKAENHKWFSILARFRFFDSEQKIKFCKKHYGVDSHKTCVGYLDVDDAINEQVKKLAWNEISESVVRREATDLFTKKLGVVKRSNFEHLLGQGGMETTLNVARAFSLSNEMDTDFVDYMLGELRDLIKRTCKIEKFVEGFIKSISKGMNTCFYEYVNKILNVDKTNSSLAYYVYKLALELSDFSTKEGKALLMQGLLYGEPLNGEKRQEYIYQNNICVPRISIIKSSDEVRDLCLGTLRGVDDIDRDILRTMLINKSRELGVQKPRYYENSVHHRTKLRIALALFELNSIYPQWNDYYLTAVIHENNQRNVTYLFETMIAKTISEQELIKQLDNLKSVSSHGQVSLFAIAYFFMIFHSCSAQFVEFLIGRLLPFTMYCIFNTRLYAQIAILYMIRYTDSSRYYMLKDSITAVLNATPNAMEKVNTDIRFTCPTDISRDAVLYVTAVPEDEKRYDSLSSLEWHRFFKKAREVTLNKRRKENLTKNVASPHIFGDYVQCKSNPYNYSSDSEQDVKSGMIVVASLIDKLPNLGGIARTCEVLGIKNLVVDSLKKTESSEFKTLSMTAEKWLNLSERKPGELKSFIQLKKNEGYTIIGAEQTSKSVSFIDYEFPYKCVLLLGQEKEGIPADLLSLLDAAVEIPQFGMVRSLNVHVTGALFMFEYCKQHLQKQ